MDHRVASWDCSRDRNKYKDEENKVFALKKALISQRIKQYVDK